MKDPHRATTREVRKIHFAADLRMKDVPKVCGAGCSFCCHQLIRLDLAEAPGIERFILEELSEPVREQVRTGLRRWLAFFDANTPAEGVVEEADLAQVDARLVAERVPCPFLVDDCCAIYKVRPLVCRTYTVNDDPALCRETPNREGDPAGLAVHERARAELGRVTGVQGVRLLNYAVQEVLGLDHACKPVRLMLTPGERAGRAR